MLNALRHANDGFAVTIWEAADGNEEGWKVWRTLDAKYAEKDPGWVMTIPMNLLCGVLQTAMSDMRPARNHVKG